MRNKSHPAKRLLLTMLMGAVTGFVAPAFLTAAASAAVLVSLPDFSPLVDKVGPAVVNIRTTAKPEEAEGDAQDEQMKQLFKRFFGQPVPPSDPEHKKKEKPADPSSDVPAEQIPRGIGSGFIISRDGFILTNAHVVDGADEVFVRLTDQREFKARVIGIDTRTDVAVLKIDGTALPEVTIGNSSKTKVGEWVIAIGSPFDLENTVTSGIISAKARDTGDFLPLIQTDVAVNPGNSGGPLINMRGEVVGINSQIYSRSGGFMGISFAVPINEAIAAAEQLKTSGFVSRGRLGVYLSDVGKDIADAVGPSVANGSLVGRLEKDGPAELAGIQGGDIITKLNNVAVNKSAELRRLVASVKPGTKISLGLWRKGSYQNIDVVLGSMEADKTTAQVKESEAPAPLQNALGIIANDLSVEQKGQLRLAAGVVIAAVDGVSAGAGLLPGDIILTFNNVDVTTTDQFTALSAQLDTQKKVLLLVRRGENTQFFTLRPDRTTASR